MVDMKHLRQWFDIADKDFDVANKMAASFWPPPVEQKDIIAFVQSTLPEIFTARGESAHV